MSARRAGGARDALVVGGGIVGAALALGLHRLGLEVELLEARPLEPWSPETPDLRVYALASDGEALLDRLGVWPAVRAARVQPYAGMHVWDAGGGRPLRFDAASLGVPRLGHIVEHALLVDRLHEALRRAGIPCTFGATVEAMHEADSRIDLVLAGGERRSTGRLFGADGAASAVRALAGIGVEARDYGSAGLVAYLVPEKPHDATCWQRFLPTGPLALLPCAGGRVSIVWSLPEYEAMRLRDVPAAQFEAEIARASDRALGELRLDSPRVVFPLRRQLARMMLAGRVALVGDAAHVVHPLAGQGVNLGLRDVAGLLEAASSARDAGRPSLSDRVLERWARTRFSENSVAARSFEWIHDVYANASPLPVALRGWALAAANLPPVNRALWRRAAGLA
ncbi:MAG: FAD-dependent monooxygenase [Lysobacteraceae bacterium]